MARYRISVWCTRRPTVAYYYGVLLYMWQEMAREMQLDVETNKANAVIRVMNNWLDRIAHLPKVFN